MATVTPNFNWPVPTSTDLVKDGATAIEALGDSIDGSLVDLKGGTTGQVLSKTSGTDMDFTWVTTDDANAIQNSIVDAKGDLISATANDTPARLAVGANGETLVADSSTSTGLRYQGNFAAGKNKIINGDFGIWQRGTSFTMTNGVSAYTADRFSAYFTFASGSASVSRQTFTAGTAPVAGYEGQFFLRATKPAVNGYCIISQPIEDVRTFAGQTITISFWAKINSGTLTATMYARQKFGSGGSGDVNYGGYNYTVTTSWQRFSQTITLSSIAGKTIGTGSSLYIDPIFNLDSSGYDIDIWGLQVEAGSVATAFQTATGTTQGELSACQRYYWRNTTTSTYGNIGLGYGYSTTQSRILTILPVQMRTTPSSVDFANLANYDDPAGSVTAITAITLTATQSTPNTASLLTTVASGLTQYRPYILVSNNNAAGYLGFSAEL
jgi:hypothetical protein